MKKIIIILFIFHCPFVAICQWYTPTQSYQNLEKYWFYHYRLVNDFMYVDTTGNDSVGSIIPAQKSERDSTHNPLLDADASRHYYHHDGVALRWEDATTDLGHYIGALRR